MNDTTTTQTESDTMMTTLQVEQERERQNTVAAKQRAEAKVEKLEDLVEAIAARCRLSADRPGSIGTSGRVQELIENHRASQRNL
jgi:hypothetical protein